MNEEEMWVTLKNGLTVDVDVYIKGNFVKGNIKVDGINFPICALDLNDEADAMRYVQQQIGTLLWNKFCELNKIRYE